MLKTLRLRHNFDSWFGAVPARLYMNRQLNSTDRDVFGAISMCLLGKPGEVEITQEEIGDFLGLDERTVKRSIARLRAENELGAERTRIGRNAYRLVNPPLAKGRRPAEAKEPAGPRVMAQCGKCQRPVKRVGKQGWCRSCKEDADLSTRVWLARSDLGPNASPEELAAHLKNSRLALRIRRLLEKSAAVA